MILQKTISANSTDTIKCEWSDSTKSYTHFKFDAACNNKVPGTGNTVSGYDSYLNNSSTTNDTYFCMFQKTEFFLNYHKFKMTSMFFIFKDNI